jgi:protoporphyrinogen oxidase
MKIGIMGGGLSGISLAYFLQKNDRVDSIDILEKENNPGGLCRSFNINGSFYDIGPHIIFSRDHDMLELMINLLGDNKSKIKRSNKIYYKNKFIKYPFENDLFALPEEDREYCLNTFLHNPHKNQKAENLLQFFLKTFGEGITNIYLKPYNEKIWKYDLTLMDTLMADRIPQPPREDIIKGAGGASTEGYVHQLYFYYPQNGGINSLIKAFVDQFNDKVNLRVNNSVTALQMTDNKWKMETSQGDDGVYDLVVSTMPVQSLMEVYQSEIPRKIRVSVDSLKYNSIVITVINLKKDNLNGNLAVMIPDKAIIFHRVSKINLLGGGYGTNDNSTNLMTEITYAKDSLIDKMNQSKIDEKIIEGLIDTGFIDSRKDINFMDTKKFEYAYVIYDLEYKKNMSLIRNYFENQGIKLCGRFGEFEYLNMDAVLRHARDLSEKIEHSIKRT